MRFVFNAILAAVLTSALNAFRLSDSVGGNLWWWEGEGAETHVTYSYFNIGITAITWCSVIYVMLLLGNLALVISRRIFQVALVRRHK